MLNYNILFESLYSDLPESVKTSIIDRLPEETLVEGLNESSNPYEPILEVLDILAYSEDITEEKANSIIDEIFSNMDEQVTEEILESFIKEKSLEYITELLAHGTDAIGLKQAREQGNADRRKRIEGELRKRAFKQGINKAVTGAREATEKAVSKGAELYGKLNSKAKEVKSNITNKAGELKNKAVSGIKNAVGRVKDWAKKATEPSAKDYANAIGKKATENELKIKPGSYADRYGKALKKYEERYGKASEPKTENKPEPEKVTTNSVKANADNTEVAKTMKAKTPEKVKANSEEKVKKQTKTTKTKKEESKVKAKKQPEAKKEEEVKKEEPKVEATTEKQPEPKKEEEVKKENVENLTNIQSKGKKEENRDSAKGSEDGKKKSSVSPTVRKATAMAAYKASSNQENKDLQRVIDTYESRLKNMKSRPGYSSAEADELEKKIAKLRDKLTANESYADFITLLLRSNISESSFIEVVQMTNPIKKKEVRKKKFKEIVKKRFKKD